MVSTADVKAGVVMFDAVVPAVVITSMDVSTIPVELQRMPFCRSGTKGSSFCRSGAKCLISVK